MSVVISSEWRQTAVHSGTSSLDQRQPQFDILIISHHGLSEVLVLLFQLADRLCQGADSLRQLADCLLQ